VAENPDNPDPANSGSVPVEFSGPALPKQDESAPVPTAVDKAESQPVTSGPVSVAVPHDQTGPVKRSRRVTAAASAGIEKLGGVVESIGEGVSKLGDLTNKVPLVGAGVGALGEGITKAGESIHALPRVAATRRGQLLLRSVIVGFTLVFAWIAVIVGWQLRTTDTPDFRPSAERILVQLSRGSDAIGDVYEHASPRFQEMVRKERFIDDMTDMAMTVGKFREITSINGTLVTSGPTGQVGRVSLTAAYDNGVCKGSISFHRTHGEWKLLGIGVELPHELKITQAQREQRVAACKDPDDRKTCDVRDAAETILEELRDGLAGQVWDQATDVFKKQESRATFEQIQEEHRDDLGAYKRILTVTEAKVIEGTSATYDVLAEFEKSSAVRCVFGFYRGSKSAKWQLRSMKIVVPMPRAEAGSAE
jgi:hypothetical protein